MGRNLIAACMIAAALVSACAEETERSDAPEGACDVAVQNVAAFATPGTSDTTIEGRAYGPDCRRAVLTLAIRDKNGEALWAFAAPYAAFTYEMDASVAIPRSQVEEQLASWVNVIIDDTGELPEWIEGQPAPGPGRPRSDETPLDRATYEALRAQKAPRLCYGSSVQAIECIAYDPATGVARFVYRSAS